MLSTHFSGISIKISIDFSRFPRKQILFSTSLSVPLALVLFVQHYYLLKGICDTRYGTDVYVTVKIEKTFLL